MCGNDLIRSVPMSNYAGKKIAIDASMYVCRFTFRGDNYLESCIELITALLEAKIIPLFVFDGDAPPEKSIEREIRRQKKRAQYLRIEDLERELDIYHQTGRVSPSLAEINAKTRRKRGAGGVTGGRTLVPDFFNVKAVTKYIADLRKQMLNATKFDFLSLKRLLNMFGVSYLDAIGEAEITCARLSRIGIVDAVLSCDTDIIACGAPIVLKGFKGSMFFEISLAAILEKLSFDYCQLLDFCIMCGTDFNRNIPRLGPVKAYAVILKHKTIDALTTTTTTDANIDASSVSILNHERVREIFTNPTISSLDTINVQSNEINFDAIFKLIITERLKISPSVLRKKLTS